MRALEQTQHEISHTIQLLEQIKAHQHEQADVRERELQIGTVASELQAFDQAERGLRAQQQTLQQSLAELRSRREQQLASYQAAKRARQILSELRDQQRERLESEAARNEQRRLDDLFLARRSHR